MIQKQTNRLTARRRSGQQQQRHLPVIELNSISGFTVDGSLQATGAMTQVTGMAFVTIHNGYTHSQRVRQCLVALESIVDAERTRNARTACRGDWSSQLFQKWALAVCSRALRLP